ncbi:hypothetical protein ACVIGB_005321 [Bradyrhizobium sp. USDA 4341]
MNCVAFDNSRLKKGARRPTTVIHWGRRESEMMRARRRQWNGELLGYLDLEAWVRRDRRPRAIRAIVNQALPMLEPECAALYSSFRRRDPAGEAAGARTVAGVLFDALRAASDGTAGKRPAVPPIRRLRPFGVPEELQPAAARRHPGQVLAEMLGQPRVKKLLSCDHFSVDGPLIEGWASMKSVEPRDGSG